MIRRRMIILSRDGLGKLAYNTLLVPGVKVTGEATSEAAGIICDWPQRR